MTQFPIQFNPNEKVLFDRHVRNGLVSTGIAAPTTVPSFVGLIFCDTTNAKVYISTGVSASTDWKLLN